MTVEKEIIQKIEEYDTIIIHRHQHPDPDAYGSQGGLATAIMQSFPAKKVYQVGKNIPGLNWITVENEDLPDETYKNALVIVTDTANTPRVDDDRYNKGDFLIKIDHHPNDDQYGDLSLVNTNASSCSEIIHDLILASEGKLELTAEVAEKLYAGISSDTGRFMYDATTAHTMEVVASLMRTCIDTSKINRRLDSITLPVARLSAYVYENMKITKNNAAYIILNHDKIEEFDLGDAGTSAVVPLLGKINTTICWTVFVQQKDGTYRLRVRSKGPVINELAKEYQGGGHPLASGARIDDANEIPAYIEKLDGLAKKFAEEHDMTDW